MNPPRISRRTALLCASTGFGFAVASTLVLALSGCASSSDSASSANPGLRWAGAGRTRRLKGFARMLVRDFKESVSGRSGSSTIDRREAEKAAVREATRTVPDRIAEAVSRTGAFAPVLREGAPDQLTLVMDGTLVRYNEGDSDARRATGARFGGPQFEVRLEIRDGGSGEVLATLVAENAPAGGGQRAQAAESLEGAVARVAWDIAQTISVGAR